MGAISDSNYEGQTTGTFIIGKANQTVTFGSLSARNYGEPDFAVSATASSALPPDYSILSGPATVSGSTVTLTGAGTVVVRAGQVGDNNYNAALGVDQSFVVRKGTAVVTLGALSAVYDGTPNSASATTNPTGLAVTLTYDGSLTGPTQVGSYGVVGTITDSDYEGSASGTLVIVKAPQTISFNAVPGVTASGVPFAVSATTTANLPITLSVISGSASLTDGNVTVADSGSVTIRAGQAGDASYSAAADIEHTFTVGKANQAISFAAFSGVTPGGAPITLGATSSSGLAVSFSVLSGPGTISGTALTIVGAEPVVVRASQAGDSVTNAAPDVDQRLTVGKTGQSVAFAAVAGSTYGDPPMALVATSTSGLAPAFSVLSGPALVAGGMVTFTGAGIVHLRASQPGDAFHNPAPNADQYVVVGKKLLNATVGHATRLYGAANPSFTIVYSGFVGADTVAVIDALPAASSSAVSATPVGTVPIIASGGGDGDYTFNYINASLTITPAPQTLTFGPLGSRTFGDPGFALGATSSSGLPADYIVLGGPATIAGGWVEVIGEGAVLIRAAQAGNANYSAASSVDQTFFVHPGATPAESSEPVPAPAGTPIAPPSQPPAPISSAPPAPSFSASTGPQIFFGSAGDFAGFFEPGQNSGVVIGIIPLTREGFVVPFSPDSSGEWTVSRDTVSTGTVPTPRRTFRGKLQAGQLSVTIDDLSVALVAPLASGAGDTVSLAGYYPAANVGGSRGNTYIVASAQGGAFVLAVSPARVEAAMGDLTAMGELRVSLAQGFGVAAAIDPATGVVRGTVSFPAADVIDFAGLSVATLRTDRLVNLSARGATAGESGVLVSGFVIRGPHARPILLRGVGPGLTAFAVAGVQANPRLELYRDGVLIAENDDWEKAANPAELAATTSRLAGFALTAGSKDAALFLSLEPGAYTAHVVPQGVPGVALAEIYDGSTTPNLAFEERSLVNLSSRGPVGAGDGVLIGGFVVTGNAPKTILVRAGGPALADFGVTGALADPVLSIYAAAVLLARNDNWGTPLGQGAPSVEIAAAARSSGAFDFTAGSRDSALLITLAPGSYTAQISGVDNATGIALIEVYEVSP